MPEFDIVNKVDLQEVDNAVNGTLREIAKRYDFRGSKTELSFNKKEQILHIVTEDEMKMKAVGDMLSDSFVKRGINPKTLDYQTIEPTSQGMVKRDIKLRQGIDADTCRNIAKTIKDTKLKVQVKIQGDTLRVSGKQIDDLQEVIQLLKGMELPVPLQFVNMKR